MNLEADKNIWTLSRHYKVLFTQTDIQCIKLMLLSSVYASDCRVHNITVACDINEKRKVNDSMESFQAVESTSLPLRVNEPYSNAKWKVTFYWNKSFQALDQLSLDIRMFYRQGFFCFYRWNLWHSSYLSDTYLRSIKFESCSKYKLFSSSKWNIFLELRHVSEVQQASKIQPFITQ